MTEKKKLRAALYLRVSTDEQAKEGHYGLEVQEERGRQFCESQEYSLSEENVYKDDISGALPVDKRPELSKLFASARAKEFDVVVVYKIDRLSRGLRNLLNAVHDLNAIGIGFRSVTEAFDTSTSHGRANVNMFGMFAELEKDVIRERTMSGKLKAAKAGKWVTGIPPYGYKVDKDTRRLVIDEPEAKVVRKIYNWLVRDKLSQREIEKRMNDLKIPSPYSTKIRIRETHNYWFKRTIGRILTNEVYTGTFFYRKYKRPFNNLTSLIEDGALRPADEWVQMQTEPIISTEMFEAAKAQLTSNREFAKRNQKREYLFSKLIYCSECNHKMFGGFKAPKKEWEHGNGRYYHGIYRNDPTIGKTKRCDWCPRYSEPRLEPIWECLLAILQNPQNMLRPLEQYMYKESEPVETRSRLVEIEVELATIKKKQDRVSEMYIEEQITKHQYQIYQQEYKRDQQRLNDEIVRLQQVLLTKQEKGDRSEAIQESFTQIQSRLTDVSYENKAKIISIFVQRITLHAKDDYAEVVFRFDGHTDATGAKVVSLKKGKSFPLVLNIKTVSEYDRRVFLLKANPGMGVPITLV